MREGMQNLKILKNRYLSHCTPVRFTVSPKAVTLSENNNGTEEEQIKQAVDINSSMLNPPSMTINQDWSGNLGAQSQLLLLETFPSCYKIYAMYRTYKGVNQISIDTILGATT